MRSLELLAGLALTILTACGDQSGLNPAPIQIAGFSGIPVMNPGQDCLCCHSTSYTGGGLCPYSHNASRRPWTVAGTVFGTPDADVDAGIVGAEVLITVGGKQYTLVTNQAGNFYTGEDIGDGVFTDVQIQWKGKRMRMNLDSAKAIGACNSCHTVPPLNGALGRLYVPGP
jgi:hypothetical protein